MEKHSDKSGMSLYAKSILVILLIIIICAALLLYKMSDRYDVWGIISGKFQEIVAVFTGEKDNKTNTLVANGNTNKVQNPSSSSGTLSNTQTEPPATQDSGSNPDTTGSGEIDQEAAKTIAIQRFTRNGRSRSYRRRFRHNQNDTSR